MNKKLIASAMGAVMAGGMGLAHADVKLYGRVDVSVDATDSDVKGTVAGQPLNQASTNGVGYKDDVNMNSNASRIGVKGSEDLGNGLSAIFKIEWQVDVTNGGAFSGRDQWVGMKMENFGQLTFGTNSTAYKSTGGQIDAFIDTPLEMRSINMQSRLHTGKGTNGEGRGLDMVRYDSPSIGGAKLIGTYQFNPNGQGTNPQDDDPYSVALQYKGNNLFLGAAYITTQQDNDNSAAEFTARWDIGDFSVHGIYELDKGLITAQSTNGTFQSFSRRGSSQDDGANMWAVGGTFTLGNNVIGADYGQRDSSNGVNGNNDSNNLANVTGGTFAAQAAAYDDIQQLTVWRVAAYHSFSKRTRAYFGYASTDYDDKGTDTLFSLGMRHYF